ncbi:MAG: hypothetical protein QOD99_2254, partial [Chthoniobacter sp.]|nr:hypothetical protein [Chthoniobacter sp.]
MKAKALSEKRFKPRPPIELLPVNPKGWSPALVTERPPRRFFVSDFLNRWLEHRYLETLEIASVVGSGDPFKPLLKIFRESDGGSLMSITDREYRGASEDRFWSKAGFFSSCNRPLRELDEWLNCNPAFRLLCQVLENRAFDRAPQMECV